MVEDDKSHLKWEIWSIFTVTHVFPAISSCANQKKYTLILPLEV